MITSIDLTKQDVEDTIDSAIAEFREEHSRKSAFLVLGRLAYEELRDMMRLNADGAESAGMYKGLQVVVVEAPTNLLTIGCLPD